jgi:hypothetical protein
LRLHRVEGRLGDATVDLSGEVRLEPEPDADLDLGVTALPLEALPLDLLPTDHPLRTRLEDLLQRYRPEGLIDAGTRLAAAGAAWSVSDVRLQPRRLSFDYRGQRFALADLDGTVVHQDQVLRFEGFSGHFGGDGRGRFRLDGRVGLGEQPSASLRFDLSSPAFDDRLLTVLPGEATSVLRALDLRGGYAIKEGRLTWHAVPSADAPALDLHLPLTLDAAGLDLGLGITGLDGSLLAAITREGGDDWPRVRLDLEADQLRAGGRRIAPLTVTLTNETQRDRLLIRNLRGRCYGGSVVGEGQVDLADRRRVSLDLRLDGSALALLLDPAADRPAAGGGGLAERGGDGERPLREAEAPPEADDGAPRGRVAGRLILGLVPGEPGSRRGRGALEVRDARLYRMPLALSLLQIVHARFPQAQAFSHASVRFLVDGELARIQRVRFDADSVQIAGAGTMHYPSRRLDLQMVSRNAQAWDLGLVGEAIDKVRDELLSIQITGTLDQPQTRVQTLSGITDWIEQIFGADEDADQLLGPGAPSTSGQ